MHPIALVCAVGLCDVLWCHKQRIGLLCLCLKRLNTRLHTSILDSGEMPLSFSFPWQVGPYYRWICTGRGFQMWGRSVYFICAFLLAILHFASSFSSTHMTTSWFRRIYLHSFTKSFVVQTSFWQNLLRVLTSN